MTRYTTKALTDTLQQCGSRCVDYRDAVQSHDMALNIISNKADNAF